MRIHQTLTWILLAFYLDAYQCYAVELSEFQGFVESHCLDCHHSSDPAGSLDLETPISADDFANSIAEKSALWEKVAKRLGARQMPPVIDVDGKAVLGRPTEAEYVSAQEALVTRLDVLAAQDPKPGRTTSVRRLTRAEYRNAIRDLLGLEVDVEEWLPADPLAHGFDNVTVSGLSPILLNRYITAAQRISRAAIGGEIVNPIGRIVRLPPDLTQDRHIPGLPLGTRGGVEIKHHFPNDGDYEIQLRLMRDRDENIEGLKAITRIDLRLDRELVHQFFVQPGKGSGGNWKKDDTLVDANLRKRIAVPAGEHRLVVTFPDNVLSVPEIHRQPFDASFNRHRHPRLAPAIYEVSIIGPFDARGPGDTKSRKRIFGATTTEPLSQKDAEAEARRILSRLIRIAYRRPIQEADLSTPLRFFRERFETDGFERGIESALTAVLVNPHFLFRAERDPDGIEPGEAYSVSDLQLASRLSFFLWSSLPDDTLLSLAQRGELGSEEQLRAQVRRMLQDPRADSLVTNFASQWLYLRNLESLSPDLRSFPDFDENLRQAFRSETEMLFRHVMQNDLSILKLIDSDIVFLNDRLAQHYRIPGVVGSHFRPIKVDQQKYPRGGILRHGSILSVTSYATRTSPTIRGNWILENLLGTPAPPPPPNVPSLQEKKASSATTVRQRLAEHRKNPACASCHNLMDPVGFALENYDALGRWRYFEGEERVDSSGRLPHGTIARSVGELEAGILERPDVFASAMTGKLLTYALGRGVEPEDGPAIRQIVRQSAVNQFRFHTLVQSIVGSAPFRMRTAE